MADVRLAIAAKLSEWMAKPWDDLEDFNQQRFLDDADGVLGVLREADLESVLEAIGEVRPWYSGQFIVRRHGTEVPS